MKDAGRFELRPIENSYVLDIFGEVDFANVADFSALIADAADRPPNALIVSLAHATYFDSQLIHAVLRGSELFRLRNKSLLLVSPSGNSGRRIIEILGLANVLPVFESLDAALASLPAHAT